MGSIRAYIFNLLIGLDQFLNTLIGGFPDETLSSSAYVGELEGRVLAKFFRPLIDALFYFYQPEHCKRSFESELLGLQLPNSYRNATSVANDFPVIEE